MSRALPRGLLLVLVLGSLCGPCAAADGIWAAFVETSDSSQDPAILEAVAAGDFDTRLEICAAMGRRADPRAESLIAWLLVVSSRGKAAQSEHLLRVLLESLFDPERGVEALQQRYRANREVLAEAEARWSTFSDPQLRGALLRLLHLFERAKALPILAAAGADIVQLMRETGGVLSPRESGLALDFLAVVEQVPSPDLFEPCLSISRLARERPIIDRARRVTALVRAKMGTAPALPGP